MKKIFTTIILILTAGMTSNAQGWTDVTDTYIVNPGFESCTATTSNVATQASSKAYDYTNEGWTAETVFNNVGQTWSCAAVYTYASGLTLNQATVPTADNYGNSGKTLGISIGRQSTIFYRSASTVKLPAGNYRLSIYCNNQNEKATRFALKLGFIANDGNSFVSKTTNIPYNVWTKEEISFKIEHETEGRFQIGGQADMDINSYSSHDYAKMFFDNMTLEYVPLGLPSAIADAKATKIPTANVGNGPLQYNKDIIDEFLDAIKKAEEIYSRGDATEEELQEAEEELRLAIAYFNADITELNPPEKQQKFKFTSTCDWTKWKPAYSYLNGGVITLTKSSAVNTQGGYVIALGIGNNQGGTVFTHQPFLAQAFTLTPAEGMVNGYLLSMTDEEGNTRYLCSGSPVGGNRFQIRATTDINNALTVVIVPTDEEGVYNLLSTACNVNIAFQDTNAYCDAAWTGHSDGFKISIVQQPLEINLNLNDNKYGTFIFPFAQTEQGENITDIVLGKNNALIFSSNEISTENSQLILTPEYQIKANKPYIIFATEDIDINLKGYGTANQNFYSEGILIGTYTGELPESTTVFALNDSEGSQQAFSQVDGNYKPKPFESLLYFNSLPDHNIYFLPKPETVGIQSTYNNQETLDIQSVYDNAGIRRTYTDKGFNIIKTNDGNVVKVFIK